MKCVLTTIEFLTMEQYSITCLQAIQAMDERHAAAVRSAS